MLMKLCACFRQHKLKIVLWQYLRAMKILSTQTGTATAPISTVHLHYVQFNNMTQRHGIDPELR